MNKEGLQALAALIENLARYFVNNTIHALPERQYYVDAFQSIQKQAHSFSFSLAVDFCFSLAEVLGSLKEDQVPVMNEVVSYGIDSLQRITIFEQTAIPQPESLDVLRSRLDSYRGVADQKQSAKIKEEYLPEFIGSAMTLIDDLEKDLLSLEHNPQQKKLIDKIFRHFHTLKGDAHMVGIDNLAQLAHTVETILSGIRKKGDTLTPETITMLLYVADTARESLYVLQRNPAEAIAYDMSSLQHEVEAAAGIKTPASSAEQKPQPTPDGHPRFIPRVPQIDFSLGREFILDGITESKDHLEKAEESLLRLEVKPDDHDEIHKIFRAFHTIKGIASFVNLEDIKILTHDTETMMDLVLKGALRLTSAEVDTILSAIDATRKLLDLVSDQVKNKGVLQGPYYDASAVVSHIRSVIQRVAEEQSKPVPKKLGSILIDKGIIADTDLDDALQQQAVSMPEKRIGEILVEEGVATKEQISRALQEQQKGVETEGSLKIKISKLDSLIDMMGELVIVGTQVAQHPEVQRSDDGKFVKDIHQMEKIIREVQTVSMSMRLVPIQPLFQRMTRMIRDLSKRLCKEIDVVIHGEETEIDKNMIELVSDPMLHMARNAVDHGIETMEARRNAGKSLRGRVDFNAYHKGGNVVIEISDDGQGLSKERIRKKAIEQKILSGSEEVADSRLYQLIFEPGFSTAEQVTEVSGRGVGMDVVRRNVEKMNGKIDISTEDGKGSRFSITLPLTLAVIDGFVLELGRERYIIPITAVMEFVQPRASDIVTVIQKGEMLNVRGQLLPLIRLNRCFQAAAGVKNIEDGSVCIVESDQGRAGILIDKIIGQQQIVIKALGDRLKGVKGVSGGTILGDGRVGLILDINGIMLLSRSNVFKQVP